MCDKPLAEPVKTFVFSISPSCPSELPSFAVKCVVVLAVIVALLILIAKLVGAKIVGGVLLAIAAVAAVYFSGALIYNIVTRKKLLRRFGNERGN